ncbi:hypothetical protein HanIR_Chr01g0025481 [Helianthus annuus]|nr:hypothetical protein HanIR_Chr01g0025481 [Helianthus annuus]
METCRWRWPCRQWWRVWRCSDGCLGWVKRKSRSQPVLIGKSRSQTRTASTETKSPRPVLTVQTPSVNKSLFTRCFILFNGR